MNIIYVIALKIDGQLEMIGSALEDFDKKHPEYINCLYEVAVERSEVKSAAAFTFDFGTTEEIIDAIKVAPQKQTSRFIEIYKKVMLEISIKYKDKDNG